MSYYPVLDEDGNQNRKKGKLVWIIDIVVPGLLRYQKRHRGTRTEISRLEGKIREDLERRGGRAVYGQLKDPTFREYAYFYIEYVKPFQKTWKTTATRINNFLKFLEATGIQNGKLSEFTTTDVMEYMRWRRNNALSRKLPSEVTIKRLGQKTAIEYSNYLKKDSARIIKLDKKASNGTST